MHLNINAILERIREIQKEKGRCIVSVDGRCASGKSTLGKELQRETGGELIHMDDFYLRPEQRTKERYETPGENVDHERFLEEVLIPLYETGECAYRKFDPSVMALKEDITDVKRNDVYIIEGSYSQREDLSPYYDLKIFMTIDPETQIRRIEKRNPDKVQMFREKWIPLEELYFRNVPVQQRADMVIINDFENCAQNRQ